MCTIIEDSCVSICIQKIKSFKTTQEVVRGRSNLLVANLFGMVVFKILVLDAILFEETLNRSSYEIWKPFLSWMCLPFI